MPNALAAHMHLDRTLHEVCPASPDSLNAVGCSWMIISVAFDRSQGYVPPPPVLPVDSCLPQRPGHDH